MKEELLPCPYCGAPGFVTDYEPVGVGGADYVECGSGECRAMGPDGNTRAEAIERWNQRTPPPADTRGEKK